MSENWRRDAIEAEVESEEAQRNENRPQNYDFPESISALAAKRRICQPLTAREQNICNVNQLVEQFFADLREDLRDATDVNLRAWLWFTCPTTMRTEVEREIRSDSRWTNKNP